MKISDLFLMSLRNLTRRKLRAFLTILGVLIGATSIVVMLSIGLGLTQIMTGDAKANGTLNTLKISPKRQSNKRSHGKKYVKPVITKQQLGVILNDPNINAVTPYERISVTAKYKKFSMYPNIYAVDPLALQKFKYKLDAGRYLNTEDKLEVVVGAGLHKELFLEKNNRALSSYGEFDMSQGFDEDGNKSNTPKVNFLNRNVDFTFDRFQQNNRKLRPYKFKVVGILKAGDYDRDRSIYVNYLYMNKFIHQLERKFDKEAYKKNRRLQKGFNEVQAYMINMKKSKETIKRLSAAGFNVYSEANYINQTKKQLQIVQAVLGGIGAISLLVAAIGITNTMIMSIYERTKEIGVMKVIGANINDIKRLFLLEAAFIGFWGGVAGIGLSYLLSSIINQIASGYVGNSLDSVQKISVIPVWLVVASILFSTLVGILSGYLPAKRAMKLSARQAISTQ